ncbi:MAG: hypothetical protein HY791_39335 [Deltaproteobacteria bacterium]|nr:hypothetical protein [Deltaproteobacteria bacterium]
MNQPLDTTKLQGPSIRLSTVATSTRQTPKTDFGTVMRDGLLKASNVAMEGLQVAAPFIPGSAIVSAAVAGANLASNVSGPAYGGGGGASGGVASAGVGTGAFGLSGGSGPAGGSRAAVGSYGADGGLAIPGRSPGYSTNMNQSPSNFAPSSMGGSSSGVSAAGTEGGDAYQKMMGATKQMAEFQASFNLQYLQLQEKIQQDTRQFNLVSNIMKTKHDAAKNALNNVR